MAAHSAWHRCKRWRDRGFVCPMGVKHGTGESEEDAEPVRSGNRATAVSAMAALVSAGAAMAPRSVSMGRAMSMGEEAASGAVADALAPRGPGLKPIAAAAALEVFRQHVKGRRFAPTRIIRVGGFGGMQVNMALRMEQLMNIPTRR